MEDDGATTWEDAYETGVSDGEAWARQHEIGALAGDHEHLIPDDFYGAYVRGVGEGIRRAQDDADTGLAGVPERVA